jgi:hypothetical protein
MIKQLLTADFGESFREASARVSWLSLGNFPRDMHSAEMSDFIGAPEEIRTPDPQIRSHLDNAKA